MYSLYLTLVCFAGILQFRGTQGHVRLSFPPARRYDLDFLDNGRTRGPCGLPSYPGAPRTTFIEGTRVRVTWHLAYAHKGGAQLQIIEESTLFFPKIIASLTNKDFLFQNDSTRQYADVIIPVGVACDKCTLRLLRQASEWSAAYRFWSCADIVILQHPNASSVQCAAKFSTNIAANTKAPSAPILGAEPTSEPHAEPGAEPTSEPHAEPAAEPTSEPHAEPGAEPTSEPHAEPGAEPTSEPHAEPGAEPEAEPTSEPETEPEPSNSSSLTPVSGRACEPQVPLEFTSCYEGKCLNSGTCNSTTGLCSCLKLFSGERCQEFDHCWKDDDCNNGKCIDTRSTTFPKLLCYCKPGWHGNNCDKRSEIVLQSDYMSNSDYYHRQLSSAANVTLHWRFLNNNQEIEIAVQARTLSWVGLGWRPQSLTDSCKDFPALNIRSSLESKLEAYRNELKTLPIVNKNPTIDPEAAIENSLDSKIEGVCIHGKDPSTLKPVQPSGGAQPEPGAEPGPTSEPRPKAEPGAEPTSEPETNAEPHAEPTYEPHAEPNSEPHAEPAAEPHAEPYAEPRYEPHAESRYEPHAEPAAEPTSEPHAEPETEPTSQPHAEPGAEPSSEPHAEPGAEPNAEPSTTSKPNTGAAQLAATYIIPRPSGAPLTHAMDCMDMVIGSVKGDLHRVQDMYTRDRSTPRQDFIYAGTDDLLGSAGSQIDGITTIVFRRSVKANHNSDHTIENGLMQVIWAIGQSIDTYGHSPETGLEACTASDYRFYRHDELKYHGWGGQRRGTSALNFFENPNPSTTGCNTMSGEYSQPSTCITTGANFNCEYYMRWELNEDSNNIRFILKSRQTQNNWIGLGISSNTQMKDTDAITAWIDKSGQAVVRDRWISGYILPPVDASNDIKDVSGSYNNGVMTIQFTRARNTGDTSDLPFSDTECQHMMYATGPLNGAKTDINKHSRTPVVSTNKVCIRPCSAKVQSKTIKVSSEIRFKNEIFTEELKNPVTSAYKQMKTKMIAMITNLYQEFTNKADRKLAVEIRQFLRGSVIAVHTVTVTYVDDGKTTQDIRNEMYTVVKDALNADSSGEIVKLYVTSDPDSNLTQGPEKFAVWKIVVVCVCVMAGIALLFAGINLCVKKKEQQDKFSAVYMQTTHSDSNPGKENEDFMKKQQMV